MCPLHGLTATAAALTALVSLPLAGQVQDQDAPIWRDRATGKILAFDITPAGDLLVLTDSGLSARDLATGQTRWVRPEVSGCVPLLDTTAFHVEEAVQAILG